MDNTTRNWVKFKYGSGTPGKNYTRISIDKRGRIRLNSYLMDKFNFAPAASLFYDSETMSIGILPIESLDQDKDAFPISTQPGRLYGSIQALSFLRCYGIKINNTLAINRIETTSDGMIIIDLRHAYAIIKRNQEV